MPDLARARDDLGAFGELVGRPLADFQLRALTDEAAVVAVVAPRARAAGANRRGDVRLDRGGRRGSAAGPGSAPRVDASAGARGAKPGAAACAICGGSLAGLSDARYCSGACRQEAYRLRRLLAGRPVGRYDSVSSRIAAFGRPRRQRRNTKALNAGSIGAPTKRPRTADTAGGLAPGGQS
jgi:hypothetical protein